MKSSLLNGRTQYRMDALNLQNTCSPTSLPLLMFNALFMTSGTFFLTCLRPHPLLSFHVHSGLNLLPPSHLPGLCFGEGYTEQPLFYVVLPVTLMCTLNKSYALEGGLSPVPRPCSRGDMTSFQAHPVAPQANRHWDYYNYLRWSPSPPKPLEKGPASNGQNKTEAMVGLTQIPEAHGFLPPVPLRSLAPGDQPPRREDTQVALWGRETKILHQQPCECATLERVLQPRGDAHQAPRAALGNPSPAEPAREPPFPPVAAFYVHSLRSEWSFLWEWP
ncbi:uncharacterized protein LOC111745553 [Pteropus vampyrus]|uniref:Uncharacterized protein LOC111745553 n=1 Tax=Pteropus vampyrus TaxID=132908 RepID=A0A6P6CXL8_PTEVA|nr:uncharacterized protein LOC111745553 [Pteropus vampyrus]